MQIPSPSLKDSLGRLTDRYHEALLESPEILSYLAGRALDLDAVRGARLGVVTDPDPMHEKYEGRLSIPYITPTGVVQIRFRCLEDHDCKATKHGKYEGVANEPTHLYNVSSLHLAGGAVGVTEGELDALVASAGLPSVGVPGVKNWKEHYFRLFEDYETVYVLADGDSAGREFVSRLLAILPNAVGRPMPEGMDVTSFVVQEGPEAFLRYLA